MPRQQRRPQKRKQQPPSRERNYLGVGARRNCDTYSVSAQHEGKHVYGGDWPSAKAAAIARDRMVLYLGASSPLNFPARSRKMGPASPEELKRQARLLAKQRRHRRNPYFGVSWSEQAGRWLVLVDLNGHYSSLGCFTDPAFAAAVHDRVVIYLRRQKRNLGREASLLNFPEARLSPMSPQAARTLAARLHKQTKTSRYRGVSRDPTVRGRPWVANLRRPSINIDFHVRYRTEREAAIAYDRAELYYVGPTVKLNFPKLAAKLEPANADTLRAEQQRDFKATTRSRFVGIGVVSSGRFRAYIQCGERLHLGVFDTEEEAAEAYDKAALRLRGKRVRLNFHPVTGEELCGQWFARQHRSRRVKS